MTKRASRRWAGLRGAVRRAPERALSVVALLLCTLAVSVGAVVGNPAIGALPLFREDAPRPVDAVFVFSGDVDFHRTAYGVAVFRALGARWFVVSGEGAGGDSGALMADAAAAAGVPREAIVFETHARTTRENVVFSAPLLAQHGVTSVAVVTDRYHSRRAALAAEHAWSGVRVIARPVPDDDPRGCALAAWATSRPCRAEFESEWKKLIGYALRGWL